MLHVKLLPKPHKFVSQISTCPLLPSKGSRHLFPAAGLMHNFHLFSQQLVQTGSLDMNHHPPITTFLSEPRTLLTISNP